MTERVNAVLICLSCGKRVEVILGLPVEMATDDPDKATTSTAYRDHAAASPKCGEAALGIQGVFTEANAATYGIIKPTLPGVPKLMLYPEE